MKTGENKVPLLALRELVVFPQQVVPLFVGREKSVRALEESQKENKLIMLAAQKDAKTNNPSETDIYHIGTLGEVVQLIRLADGTVKVFDLDTLKCAGEKLHVFMFEKIVKT